MKNKQNENEYAIEMLNITKEFPGIKANDDITLRVKKGEVHALMGENGAGKSTLMSVLFGLYQPTSGIIKINGKQTTISDPSFASNLGIGMVHQHFKLIDIFSVIDNIILGHEVKKKIPFQAIQEYFEINKKNIDDWFENETNKNIKACKQNIKFVELYNQLNLLQNEKLKIQNKEILRRYKLFNKYSFLNSFFNIHKSFANFWIDFANSCNKLISKITRKKLIIKNYNLLVKKDKFNLEEKIIVQKVDIDDIESKIQNIIKEIENTEASSEKMDVKRSLNENFKLEKKYLKKKNKLNKFKDRKEKSCFVAEEEATRKIIEISEKYGLPIDPKAKIEEISVGMQQRVEILKMLYRENDILILDEPTAVLSPQEIDGLLETIKLFKSLNKTIILITHKLNEIKAVADNCTIIRKGKFVNRVSVKETSSEKLAEMMVGNKLVEKIEKINIDSNREVLKINNLNIKRPNKTFALKDFNLEIKSGEIFGIAGVEGNGQSELVKYVAGLAKNSQGELWYNRFKKLKIKLFKNDYQKTKEYLYSKNDIQNVKLILRQNNEINIKELNYSKEIINEKNEVLLSILDDKELFDFLKFVQEKKLQIGFYSFENIEKLSIKKRFKEGISFVPEDRHAEGLILDISLQDNAVLKTFDEKPFSNFGFLNFKKAKDFSESLIEEFDIRVSEQKSKAIVRTMSGGNQQKIIIGREISSNPDLIIAIQPCRGLDVGAIGMIHKILIDQRNQGKAILLVSYELDEILKISDKIGVIYDGVLMDTLTQKEANREKIGLLMAGVKNEN